MGHHIDAQGRFQSDRHLADRIVVSFTDMGRVVQLVGQWALDPLIQVRVLSRLPMR